MNKFDVAVVKKDIIIPSGTVISTGPVKREWKEENFEIVIEFGRDSSGYFSFGISDIKASPEYFELIKGGKK